MSRLALGIDVGGSSTKAVVYRLDGTALGAGSASYRPAQPRPGVAEYDPNELIRAAEHAVREALRRAAVDAADIVAVGCDAMISGAVGLGADGTPTTPYTTTLDTRSNEDMQPMAVHEARIRELVGSGVPVIAAKIAWCRRTQPEVFAKTRVFVTAGGLVTGHFAGLGAEDAVIDPTVLWAVGLSDTRSGVWSAELCRALDVPMDRLPRIAASSEVVGAVPASVAAATGLRAGTPVIAGLGDQMAGFLGAGVLGVDSLGDSAGTYEVVGRLVDAFEPDPLGRFDVIPSATGSGYVQQAVVAIGGGFTRAWFAEQLAKEPDAARIDEAAASVAVGSDGLVFVPHLGGRGAPSVPSMRGAWFGLGWEHTLGHQARSLMEAMAFEIADAVDAFGGARPSRILGYGGGARSAVGSQIKADVSGLPFVGLGDIAPASRASALLAAIGVGELASMAEAVSQAAPVERVFEPDAARHAAYQSLRNDYREALALAAAFRAPADAGRSTERTL